MKTVTDKKSKEYIRIQQNRATQEGVKSEPVVEENGMEIQMIPMAPFFLGMPMFKFFVAKDSK